jgi:hypothetical protein
MPGYLSENFDENVSPNNLTNQASNDLRAYISNGGRGKAPFAPKRPTQQSIKNNRSMGQMIDEDEYDIENDMSQNNNHRQVGRNNMKISKPLQQPLAKDKSTSSLHQPLAKNKSGSTPILQDLNIPMIERGGRKSFSVCVKFKDPNNPNARPRNKVIEFGRIPKWDGHRYSNSFFECILNEVVANNISELGKQFRESVLSFNQ